jgi:hypothetical protein
MQLSFMRETRGEGLGIFRPNNNCHASANQHLKSSCVGNANDLNFVKLSAGGRFEAQKYGTQEFG